MAYSYTIGGAVQPSNQPKENTMNTQVLLNLAPFAVYVPDGGSKWYAYPDAESVAQHVANSEALDSSTPPGVVEFFGNEREIDINALRAAGIKIV